MLEVAESRFARLGYEGAHLESIAREVGVRKTALYHYFDSKGALYVAVLERMLLDFDAAVTQTLAREAPVLEQAGALLVAVNRLFAENRNYSEIIIRVFVDRVPVDDARLRPLIDRLMGNILAFHKRGVREGVFRKVSTRHFLSSALGMLVFHYAGGDWSARLIGVEDIFAPDAVRWRLKEYQRLLLPGLLNDPPPDGESAADDSES